MTFTLAGGGAETAPGACLLVVENRAPARLAWMKAALLFRAGSFSAQLDIWRLALLALAYGPETRKTVAGL
jgi:hypothetical protein